MAGKIIVSSVQSDTDNSISFVANTGATIFSANLSHGIAGSFIADGTITAAKIADGAIVATEVADGAITGPKLGLTSINANNIVGGTITTTQIASNTISNTNIAAGAIENYSRATGILSGMRNRIINGAMVIDQRNNGSAVTAAGSFPVDRFVTYKDTSSGTLTGQRSTLAPAGFVNSLSYTITSAFTPSASEGNSFMQPIEGFNTADLNWGSANAKTVTLSFWVRSSVTGAFGGSLRNNDGSRSYPFQYTINAANTWEYETITIPGDTSGTWLTDNSRGIMLFFSLGTGSTLTGTAGAWAANNFINSTGSTTLSSTAGATFYITGVQLEAGSTATSFEYRPYGTELALCQRYFEIGGNNAPTQIEGGGTNVWISIQYKVNKRAAPTFGLTSASNLYLRHYGTAGNPSTSAAYVTGYISTTSAMVRYSGFSGLTTSSVMFTSGTTDLTPTVDPFSISAELS